MLRRKESEHFQVYYIYKKYRELYCSFSTMGILAL